MLLFSPKDKTRLVGGSFKVVIINHTKCNMEIAEHHDRYNSSLQLAKDLLHPRPEDEKRKHKLKRLVQHPNSYFMDVKCPGCYR